LRIERRGIVEDGDFRVATGAPARAFTERIEQCFGWAKTIGPMRQVMARGLDKVNHAFTLTMAAYNLTRLRNLAALGA